MQFTMVLWRLSLLLAFAFVASALYQDEAYQIDYQHALLGAPLNSNTFFHQPSTTSKATLIYTLSDRNVLGALNPRDGSIIWRQQLANSSITTQTPGFLRAVNHTNLLYTAIGNKVSSWDAADGRLIAEWVGQGRVKSLELQEVDPLVVFENEDGTTLVRLNAANARMMWEVKDESGDIPVGLTTSSQHVYYIALVPKLLKGYQIKITQVDPFSAQQIHQLTLDSQDEVSSLESVLHVGTGTDSPIIAWADKSFKTLKLNVLGKSAITTVKIAKQEGISLERIAIHTPRSAKVSGHFLVAYHAKDAHWAEVYSIDKVKGIVTKVYDLPKLSGSGAFALSEIGGKVYFVRHSETEITLLSSENHGILEKWPIQPKAYGIPSTTLVSRRAIVEVVEKGPAKYAVRSMLTLDSGDVVLIRNGVHDWSRSESLAGISSAAWADIPGTESLVRSLESEISANFVAAYVRRVIRHIRDLQHLPTWIQAVPQRVLSNFGLGTVPVNQQLADPFGFRKLIIVATQNGRVAALDSGSQGQVLWNIQAIQLEKDERWNVKNIQIQGDVAWVLADDVAKSVFVTLSGELRTEWPLDDVPKGSQLLPVSTSASSALVSISKDGVPSFKGQRNGDQSVSLVTQPSDGSLSGWFLEGNEAIKTWNFVPPQGYRISATAVRNQHDLVASIGRALGDRNVHYKFLSPNLILVLSLNEQKSTALASLIDTVSGQLLHSAEHKGIDTSVSISAALSENWFAYVLQSDPSLATADFPGPKGTLLTIAELYESSIPNDRGPLGSSGNFSSLQSATYTPYVESATFIIPTTLTNLTTTITRQGITPRSILAYAPSLAALIAIPLAVLSPRRPVGRDPTPAEREEGLFKYSPIMDIVPTWTLSHKRELLGINGIIASPTDMESTSLIFAYGDLDVFGTRTAPIGTFDMLGKGFNKIQLILTVVALAIGTGVLAPMVRKKQIDSLWRT